MNTNNLTGAIEKLLTVAQYDEEVRDKLIFISTMKDKNRTAYLRKWTGDLRDSRYPSDFIEALGFLGNPLVAHKLRQYLVDPVTRRKHGLNAY